MSETSMDPKKKTVLQLVCVALTMGTLAWASVPLYDLFCRVTGWGGATDIADAAPGAITEEVTIRFDASNAAFLTFDVRPDRLTADAQRTNDSDASNYDVLHVNLLE